MTHPLQRLFPLMLAAALLLGGGACTPTVKVETPDKPITINMNINISHEIRVRMDKDLESAFENNADIF